MDRSRPSPFGKPTAIDYVVMIGGPLAFIAIAIWGVLWLLGPGPPDNPVSLLKKGVVKPGMSQDQVLGELRREPHSIEPRPDGGVNWVYHRGTAEPFVEEDAVIAINAQGFVVGVTFERSSPPPPAEAK